MKSHLLVILVILPCIALGQRKKHFEAPRVLRYYEGYNDCSYQYLFNAKERRSFFPFSKAASVRLISYHESENVPVHITEPGEISTPDVIPAEDTMQVFSSMAKNNFLVNYCRVLEMRDLSNAGIDSLTDLMYNVTRKPIKRPDDYGNPGAACYSPANAILFLDGKGKVSDYIEICFHCHRYYYSSSKTREISFCDQKWEMLKAFFISQGQKFGVADLSK